MDLGLKDKIVVVTGGSRGIGYATAQEFLKEGARVIITRRDTKRLADEFYSEPELD
ncbi:MAG: SDR family NAD(P)-dependent oxidoreductase [Lachnospiraceae bacterium]